MLPGIGRLGSCARLSLSLHTLLVLEAMQGLPLDEIARGQVVQQFGLSLAEIPAQFEQKPALRLLLQPSPISPAAASVMPLTRIVASAISFTS